MEQHPVPQNISSYQFHLVGDMTLKQFLELAGGVVVGVLIYATGLPGFIKWPLIIFSALIGAALAFVPFEERPLERWIIAFFRSIYSPTLFNWEKQEEVKYFADENIADKALLTQGSTNPAPKNLNKLEESENVYLNKLKDVFNFGTQVVSQNQPIFPSPTPKQASSTGNIFVPQTAPISVTQNQRPEVVVHEIPTEKPNLQTTQVTQTLVGQNINVTGQAKFSTGAAPPSLPTITNTISGQVMDIDGKIIEGAVLEILDPEGRPVRALRTNKAGHFLNVTALMDGKYRIVIEKEGFNFDPIEFEAKGKIIEPIAIRAI